MKALTRLLLASVAITLAGCASQLTVRTEVHTGEGLETPKSFALKAAERARAAREALRQLQTDLVTLPTSRYGTAIQSFIRLLPGRVAGTEAQFRQGYVGHLRQVTRPLEGETDRLIQKATRVEMLAASQPTSEEVRSALADLQTDLTRLADALQLRLNRVRDEQARLLTSTVANNYPPEAQLKATLDTQLRTSHPAAAARAAEVDRKARERYAELEAATGLPVTTESERVEAIQFLERQIAVESTDAGELIGRTLLTPLRDAQSEIAAAMIISLGDPNVPRIVGADTAKYWRKYVNDVKSTNVFGNAETAFRMEGLGESHIKSVIFDPSEVTKIGLNVFSNTLRITAAAYGLPLPGSGTATTTTTTTGSDTATPTADTSANVGATATAALSKPIIDAEIGQLTADHSIRGQKMETLFWKAASAQSLLGADATAAAPTEAVTALAALIDCLADEIEKPQTKKCGGAQ